MRTRTDLSRTARRLLAAALVLNVGALALPAGAEQYDDSVSATVTVAEPAEACLLLGAEEVAFPDSVFDQDVTEKAAYSVTSCSSAAQDILGRATSAVGESAEWVLSAEEPGTNQFQLEVAFPDSVFFPESVFLSTENRQLNQAPVDPDVDEVVDHRLVMPTDGDGIGDTMGFDIVWTAVLAE